MHRLHNRLQKLETAIVGEPFFMPLCDPFKTSHFYAQLASWGISKGTAGQVALIHASKGHLTTLRYNPDNIAEFESKLKEYENQHFKTN